MSQRVFMGVWLVILVVFLGCATVPTVVPQALTDARAALADARRAQADSLVSEDFQEAERQLKRTEAAFAGEQKIDQVEELALAARAHAEIAEARARTRLAEQAFKLEKQEHSDRKNLLAALDQKAGEMKEAKQKMKTAEAVRVAAETRAAAEANKIETRARIRVELKGILEKIKKIKNTQGKIEDQSLVITLSGKVLFTSKRSQLQRNASRILDQIAVLLNDHPDYHARVEGYMDNTGEYVDNNLLSQSRAGSVTEYLVQKGISLDRLQAVGMWSRNSILEIILEKKTETTPQP